MSVGAGKRVALEAALAEEREAHLITQDALNAQLRCNQVLADELALVKDYGSWRVLALAQSERLGVLKDKAVDVDIAISLHRQECGCPVFADPKKSWR